MVNGPVVPDREEGRARGEAAGRFDERTEQTRGGCAARLGAQQVDRAIVAQAVARFKNVGGG